MPKEATFLGHDFLGQAILFPLVALSYLLAACACGIMVVVGFFEGNNA